VIIGIASTSRIGQQIMNPSREVTLPGFATFWKRNIGDMAKHEPHGHRPESYALSGPGVNPSHYQGQGPSNTGPAAPISSGDHTTGPDGNKLPPLRAGYETTISPYYPHPDNAAPISSGDHTTGPDDNQVLPFPGYGTTIFPYGWNCTDT
jgi:hypothetical protein